MLFPKQKDTVHRLKALNLPHRNLTDQDVQCLWSQSCANLKSINLRHNKLTAVPHEVANLKALKHLDVSENLLVALSRNVRFLTPLATTGMCVPLHTPQLPFLKLKLSRINIFQT